MKRKYTESVKRYPVRFREDIGPYITIGGKKYPLDDSKYDPRLSADEVMDRFDKEYKADEADKAEKARKADLEKRTKGIVAKNKKLLSNISDYEDKLEALFDEYVPGTGKSDTLGGEIIRAVNKIGYRWYNDGDVYFIGYGKETCGPAAKFLTSLYDKDHDYLKGIGDLLIDFADEVSSDAENTRNYYSPETFDDYMDKKYGDFLNKLIKLTVDVVIDHPELFLEDTIDMYKANVKDEFEEPKFDYYIEYPYDLIEYLDRDIITESDIYSYIEDSISWMNNFNYDDLECNRYGCEFYGLDYDSFIKIDDENGNDTLLDSYVEDLKSEYGDPDDLEDEEEEDEEEDEE